MWVSKGQLNTIAYPVEKLPSIASKRRLVACLDGATLAKRREEADHLLDDLQSAAEDAPDGSGHVDLQVDDETIRGVDWRAAVVDGDFTTIRTSDEWWRLDLAEILDDLLFDAEH